MSQPHVESEFFFDLLSEIGEQRLIEIASEVSDDIAPLRWKCLWLPGVGQVTIEATRAIGDADPGAEDKGGASSEHHGVENEGGHQIRR